MKLTILIFISIVVILGLGLFMSATKDLDKPLDFENGLLPAKKSNQYVMAPGTYTKLLVDRISPTHKVPIQTLKSCFKKVFDELPRTSIILVDENNQYYIYCVRSKIFRFPDFVHLKLIELDERQSSFILFSKAKYGYSDFKVNEKRVLSVVHHLTKCINAPKVHN